MKKRVLLIAPKFYNYHIRIKEKLEESGYSVDYYDDRPSTNPLLKGTIKLFKGVSSKVLNNYMKKIINETKEQYYQIVLFITNVAFEEEQIIKLKESHKNSNYILYLWDSLINYPHNIKVIKLFDKVYSFDKKDCKNYSLRFLPLFYCDCFKDVALKQVHKYKYDISCICVAHPKRYLIIKEMIRFCNSNEIKLFSYMYLHSLILYIYNKLMLPAFKRSKYNEFYYVPLSEDELIENLCQTKIVFDIGNDGQTGLTMRTIEALGSKKKLITTNSDIINYDFYDKNNILILDPCKIEIPDSFLKTEYKFLRFEIYENYSIERWISKIINGV